MISVAEYPLRVNFTFIITGIGTANLILKVNPY